MTSTRTLLAALTILAGATFAQETPAPGEERAFASPGTRADEVRARWAAMGDAERAEFRHRLECLRNMRPEDRRFLEERARDLEARMASLTEQLPAETKQRLATLEPEKQREILDEYLTERERARGKRVRAHLPPEYMARLEAAPPEDRGPLLRALHEEMRERAGSRVIDFVCRKQDVPPDEVERLEGLSGRERMRAVLELKREHLRERVASDGPPPGVTADDWRRMNELPLEDFFERWGRRRSSREGWLDPDAVQPGEFDRERPPLDPNSRWVHRGTLLDELAELARPTLDDLLDLAHLTGRERRDVVAGRIRARCVEFLGRHPLLPPSEVEDLSAYDDQRFVDEVRNVIGRLSAPRDSGRVRDARRGPRSGVPGAEQSGADSRR
jgi:hypothetical protein